MCHPSIFSNVVSCSHLKKVMVSGSGILAQTNDTTPDGLQKTFATNVFGHFLMVKLCNVNDFVMLMLMHFSTLSYQVRQLEKKLSSQGRPCHVIWSSSQTSLGVEIDLNDIQDVAGLVRLLVCVRICVCMHVYMCVCPYRIVRNFHGTTFLQFSR